MLVVAGTMIGACMFANKVGIEKGYQMGTIAAATDIIGSNADPTAPKIYDGPGYIVQSVSAEDYDLSFDNTERQLPDNLEWSDFKPKKMGIFFEPGLSERVLDKEKLPYSFVSDMFLPENYIFRFETADGLAIHIHLNSSQLFNGKEQPTAAMSIASLGNNEYALRFNADPETFGQVITPSFYSSLDEIQIAVVNQYLFETYINELEEEESESDSEVSGSSEDSSSKLEETAEERVKGFLSEKYGISSKDGTVSVPDDLKHLEGVDEATGTIKDYDAFIGSLLQ